MPATVQGRQQRRRGLAGVVIAGALVVAFGKTALEAVFPEAGPVLPGYAQAPPPGEWADLPWGSLRSGSWEQGKKPRLTEDVAAQVGKPVRLKGFILPLHQAAEASEFFVAKNPGGCYFCNPPGVADVVMVCMAGGRKITPTDRPVYVYGKFRTATGSPDDQSLYVIRDALVSVAH